MTESAVPYSVTQRYIMVLDSDLELQREALRLAQSALEAVEWSIYGNECLWDCGGGLDENPHSPTCKRQLALDAIKGVRG